MSLCPVERAGGTTIIEIAVIGGGHVGLVHAAGFSSWGFHVTVVDADERRISQARDGRLWFYEPGLAEVISRQALLGRISFTTRYDELGDPQLAFVCVQTPGKRDGSLDLTYVSAACAELARRAPSSAVVVVRSTVPVGTNRQLSETYPALRLVSCPEFLVQGRALEDFYRPRRLVIGARVAEDADVVTDAFRAVETTIFTTDPATAELCKLAANTFLALKVSFANALARIGREHEVELPLLLRAMGADPRIGVDHLRPGLGFGGSCLPKDARALAAMTSPGSTGRALLDAVIDLNAELPREAAAWLERELGVLHGRRIAVLGLSYKPGTDDTRDSPAVALVRTLLALGATVICYDPVVGAPVTVAGRTSETAMSALAAADSADAVVLATEWPEFATLDLQLLRSRMRGHVLVDGRGICDPARARMAGLRVLTFGKESRRTTAKTTSREAVVVGS